MKTRQLDPQSLDILIDFLEQLKTRGMLVSTTRFGQSFLLDKKLQPIVTIEDDDNGLFAYAIQEVSNNATDLIDYVKTVQELSEFMNSRKDAKPTA